MKLTFSGLFLLAVTLCPLRTYAQPAEEEAVENTDTWEEDLIEEDTQEAALLPPKARQGYWIGLGGGFNLNLNHADTPKGPEELQGSLFNFQLGEMVTDWLGIGLQSNIGWSSNDQWSTLYGGLLLDVQIIPLEHLAIHLGAGVGGLRATDQDDSQAPILGTGGGYYMLGVSYDGFPFHNEGSSGGFSATPNMQIIHLPGDTFQATFITVGLNLTWWSGLDKNKLDLSLEEAYDE